MSRKVHKSYRLATPITPKQGTPITEVLIVRPRGRDLKVLDQIDGHVEIMATMIDRLCRMPDETDVFVGFSDELDVEDFAALGESVMSLITDALPTGGKS
ncbi:phage tail assembly protein [Sphingopyxis sp. YF1]|uniref:phage tail assembly protein n=1 Tax=Sphingopyxis sp. YF1 TaxID=2482763 RepID=UPI001F61F2DC|nr:phage tail assembly protein [Sphingopyxis sp. YF1]UNU43631.1 phage tail assembly protein [Sphingopyxis sp. YF1]